jgi:hypothetical protein
MPRGDSLEFLGDAIERWPEVVALEHARPTGRDSIAYDPRAVFAGEFPDGVGELVGCRLEALTR